MGPSIQSAKNVLYAAAKSREWEDHDDPTPVLDQLVPYATIIAEHEGHNDITAVLEEYLEL